MCAKETRRGKTEMETDVERVQCINKKGAKKDRVLQDVEAGRSHAVQIKWQEEDQKV